LVSASAAPRRALARAQLGGRVSLDTGMQGMPARIEEATPA
jgi:hypothetical protein